MLYYVADPMCSWCFGFAPQWQQIRDRLPADVMFRYVMGGLAADSDEPMAVPMQSYIQDAWRAVEERAGVSFNWQFWERCQPRRSTYPACRAVIAARMQDEALVPPMFAAIQKAYYLEAQNPSDLPVLDAAAKTVAGLDAERFAMDLRSEQVDALLQVDFQLRMRLGVRSFPSLVRSDSAGDELLLSGFGLAEDVLNRL